MTKPALPPIPGGKAAAPPAHLERQERELWRALLQERDITDRAGLALLRTALEAHQRARRCRERVDLDGEAVQDRWKQVKAHPLLQAERDARAAFISTMRLLGFNAEDETR